MRNRQVFFKCLSIGIVLAECTLSARAEMAPMRAVPMSKISALMTESNGAKKIDKASMTALIEVAESCFGVKSLNIVDLGSEKESLLRVSDVSVKYRILREIKERSDWGKPVSDNGLAKIKKHRAILEKQYKDKPAIWAWFLNQLGETEEAKKNILDSNEMEFTRVMALHEAVTGLGSTPLSEAEYLQKAGNVLGSESEKAEMESKMKKMKLHVSSLPQVQVMT